MRLTVFGLQRSGTNFVENCIRQNFTGVNVVNTDRQHIWKHSFGIGNNGWHAGIPENKFNDKNHLCIVIYKHPYAWMESVCTKNVDTVKRYGDMYWDKAGDSANVAYKCTNLNTSRMIDLYNDFYEFWFSKKDHFNKPIYYIKYEDMVTSHERTKEILKEIQENFGITKSKEKNDYRIPEKVGQSDKFTPDRRNKYVNYHIQRLTWDQIQYINDSMSDTLKNIMKYPLFTTEEQYQEHYKG